MSTTGTKKSVLRREARTLGLAAVALAGLAGGGIAALAGSPGTASAIWTGTAVVVLVPLTVSVFRSLAHGDVGVDVIALLAIASALAVGESLAAAIVALMMSGGNALESYAERRARRELTALLERAPRIAHRRAGGAWEEVPVDSLVPGDLVLVRAGEIVPVDGDLAGSEAVLDEAAMTGESLPVTRADGEPVRSGVSNAGEAFELRATRPAGESAYAALVALVEAAESERAPFVRMADRYAVLFLAITLVLAGAAWLASGDPVRAVAVLVVATPCPLILAAPIAMVSGLSRAAGSGIIIKGGTAIERLGEARTVLLDKTGTLTLGEPAVQEIVVLDGAGPEEILRLAASLDQLSAHVLAEALVHDAERRGLALERPSDVVEEPGQGIEGHVGGRRVTIGSPAWMRERGYDVEKALARLAAVDGADGRARVLVGAGDRVVGVVVMADRLRDDAAQAVTALRNEGVGHVAMVTGDHGPVAKAVGDLVGVDRVYSDLTPAGKLDVVRGIRRREDLRPVVMVGDGVNDAPALALADVGIAMGAAGSTVSAETADAVITVDRIDRVADAVRIGRRTLRIARQSVVAGIAMSVGAMLVAAAGYLPPVAGALFQEVIDVAVILNALRALRAGPGGGGRAATR